MRALPEQWGGLPRSTAAAGATVTMPAMDAFWGDRYGQVQDPFGHHWSFSTPLKKG